MGTGPKQVRELELETRLSFETLLSEISARFVNIPFDRIDSEIEHALRLICKSQGVDESTIYLREVDNPDIFVLSYVLRDPSLPPPPKIKFTAAENFPWCNKKLIANEIICLPDTQAAPPEAAVDKASWKKFGVWSALVIPLSTGGKRPLGFWGIDSTSKRRDWPETLQKRLKIIAGVFANALERAVSERQLRESETRLRLAADTAGAGFWTIELATGQIWATEKLKQMLGLEPDGAVDVTKFLAIVHPEDRESVQQGIRAMELGQEKAVEYRIVPSRNSVRWVMSKGNRYQFGAAKPSMLMGITFDITERRTAEEALRTLSSRLLKAQEQERKRIARELHDGVNQRLAMLAMGLRELEEVAELNAKEHARHIRKLFKDTEKVIFEIQALSHELHSSSLDYLGLVPAIEHLCREIRERHHADIVFSHDNVPKSLPSDLSLALFRIAQEALHNALKHSGVKAFEVRLYRTETHIQMTIRDSGAGFDVNAATSSRGLGLISMRERLMVLDGTLSIDSQRGRGTEINASVPISFAESDTPQPAS